MTMDSDGHAEVPFWRRKSLAEMTREEWESLCDGCGRCCLEKVSASPERSLFTDLGCRLLDGNSCRCRDYENRLDLVDTCVKLTPESLEAHAYWLPPSCAYVLLDEGKDLYWWHPLVSGDPETVHAAGVSVRGKVLASIPEVPPEEVPNFIVDWPVKLSGRAMERGEPVRVSSVSSGPTAAVDRGVSPLNHAAARAIVAGIMLAMFLSALEQTIVAPALPAIGRSLGGIDQLSWVVTAYLLAVTATTPLFGKLSDIYGRRLVLLWAIAIFIGGSIACALAPNIWVLILARGLQGLGGGGLLPIAQTIIADLLSPRERPVVQGRTSIMFMSASILGPVLGGFLTDQLHWSLIFWINLPLGAVALIMSERALRQLPRNERPHRLDMIGALLMVGAGVSLMLALAWGGTHYPWLSWRILSLLAGSVALWVLFAVRLLTAREPFIPLAILHGRVTSTITCAAFFGVGTIIGITIYTPLYCQTVLGLSASSSGLALIAFMAGTVVGSLATARLMVRLAHYMRVPLAGLLFGVIALGMLAADPNNQSIVRLMLLLFVLGCGVGPMYPVSTIVMQNAVKPHQLGTATGTLNFFRTLGGAILVAVFGAIILGGTDGAEIMTLERLSEMHGDLAPAFHWVFIAAAGCLAITFCSLALVEERPLHGPVARSDQAA
jgi:EmrB/QacA subfamily drug resistance transporter